MPEQATSMNNVFVICRGSSELFEVKFEKGCFQMLENLLIFIFCSKQFMTT